MDSFFKKGLAVLGIVFLSLTAVGCSKDKIELRSDEEPIAIGWSDWVGWAPWKVAEDQKLFERENANASLVYFNNYTKSIDAFLEGKLAAVSVTINDALALKEKVPDVQIVLANDVSDGGDGLLVKNNIFVDKVSDLKGKIVSLEKNSVSHYLFMRALEENNVDPGSIQINDVPADLAGQAFLGTAFLDDKYTQAIVTWNPHLAKAKREGKGNVLFDSSQIYGEITDVLVARKSAVEGRGQDFQGVVNAWYTVMEMLESGNREKAVATMAKQTNVTPEEFENLLIDTKLFAKPRTAIEFMGTDGKGKLLTFVERVQKFLLDQKILSEPLNLNNFINPTFVIENYNQ